jgi:hypothetical protein
MAAKDSSALGVLAQLASKKVQADATKVIAARAVNTPAMWCFLIKFSRFIAGINV